MEAANRDSFVSERGQHLHHFEKVNIVYNIPRLHVNSRAEIEKLTGRAAILAARTGTTSDFDGYGRTTRAVAVPEERDVVHRIRRDRGRVLHPQAFLSLLIVEKVVGAVVVRVYELEGHVPETSTPDASALSTMTGKSSFGGDGVGHVYSFLLLISACSSAVLAASR